MVAEETACVEPDACFCRNVSPDGVDKKIMPHAASGATTAATRMMYHLICSNTLITDESDFLPKYFMEILLFDDSFG